MRRNPADRHRRNCGDVKMKLNDIDNGNEFDFGRTSDKYAKYRDIYPQSMYEKLIAFGIGKKGQRILDLGSGTAILPINMYRTGAYFTATDISENQIAYAQKTASERGIENIDFRVCSAEDTGFDDNSFDVVTAVQCFQYFDKEKATAEIRRVLKPDGRFCVIFMDWQPYRDAVIMEMEQLVLKYNPSWSGRGFKNFRYSYPDWAENKFEIETIHSYNAALSFTKEAWLGRVKTCRGVGASLPNDKIAEFESEYREVLKKYPESLQLMHQIHIEIYRVNK